MSYQPLVELHARWHTELMNNKTALDQLRELHNITKRDTVKQLELGLVTVPEKTEVPESVYKSLQSFGVTETKLNGMVSVPLRKKDERLSNFYLMSLNGKDNMILRNGGVINSKAFSVFKHLVVTDTMDDFFTYYEQVKQNVVPLIQSYTMPEDVAMTAVSHEVEELVLLGGSPYWELLTKRLEGSDVHVYIIPLPEEKPLKDILVTMSPNKFLAYIEAEKGKQIAEKKQQAEEDKPYMTVTGEVGELVFSREDRSYRVRGFNCDGFEKIVQISMEIDGRLFPDKVDLSRSQGRSRFANIAGAEFDMSNEVIRTDLTYIYKRLDSMQDERFKEKSGILNKNIYVISKDDERKALDRLTSRDILDEHLLKDTERLGYVEEEVNKKLFYLAGISRLTNEPLSVLDISPSGSGKSFGMSTVMSLVPPDGLLSYSRLTPKALYYKAEEDLHNRVLYIEELVGMEESLESVRMLLSSGELSTSVVEKDARTGTLKTVERRIKVNMPLLSSGVRDIFDEETLSRFILTYNTIAEGHVKQVLAAQSFKFSLQGEAQDLQRERIIKKHRDMQKCFDPSLKVVNPYADKIQLNPHLHIVTRKQMQYLRLIYNIAFVRQHSREKKKEVDRFGNSFDYIEVQREDIVSANEIAAYVFQFARGDLTKRLSDAFRLIEEYCMRQTKEKRISYYEYKFSRREIREYAHWKEATAKRLFDELEHLDYVRRVRGSNQGMQFLYRIIAFEGSGENELGLFDPT